MAEKMKMIGYFVPGRDFEELLVPVIKAGLAAEGIEVITRVEEHEPSLRGYTLIIAKHEQSELLEEANAYAKGATALIHVLTEEDQELVSDEEAFAMRKFVAHEIKSKSEN